MKQPDFAAASAYALERLERELAPDLSYHSLAHTRDDVLPAAECLAHRAGIAGEHMLLLRTAACYHDIGFVIQRSDHERASICIASAVLPQFGYSPTQLAIISGMIRATHLPQTPQTFLEQIMADADLDSLGRTDFFQRSLDLRNELAASGSTFSLSAWYQRQLQFLGQHRYFTPMAYHCREIGKQCNIIGLRLLLVMMREALRSA